MLEANANALLVAQNTTIGYDSEVSDLSRNSQPVKVTFSAELVRAQESIGDEATDTKRSENTPTSLNKPSVSEVSADATEESGALELTPERQISNPAVPSLNRSGALIDEPELNTTLTGMPSNQTDTELWHVAGVNKSVSSLPKQTAESSEGVSQTTLPGISAGGEALQHDGAETRGLVSAVESMAEIKSPSELAQQGETSTNPIDSLLDESVVIKSLTSVKGESSSADKTMSNSLGNQSTGPAVSLEPEKVAYNAASVVVGRSVVPGITDIAQSATTVDAVDSIKGSTTLVGAASTVTGARVDASNTTDAGNNVLLRKIVGTRVPVETATSTVVGESAQKNQLEAASTAGEKQDVNSGLLYKPSPAMVMSGLGRTSVALNNGVDANTRLVDPDIVEQPKVSSTVSSSVPVNPLPLSNAVTSALADGSPNKVATVAELEGLRVGGGNQTELIDRKLTQASQVAGTVAYLDESKRNVALQAVSNTGTPAGIMNTTPLSTPAEIVITNGTGNTMAADAAENESTVTAGITKTFDAENLPGTNSNNSGTKNPNQHFTQSILNSSDEGVALAQQLESTARDSAAVEQQNKFGNVTPAINLKQATQLSLKPDLSSLSALNGPAEVTSSNVYHVTTNGIITANSTPLNTGLSGDLASAPRTVFLGQPDADQSMVDNLRWAVNEKLSRATINVTPANLGPITVSVDVENQNMNVSIMTNNAVAKEAIDSLLPRMREHFANEGYQQVSVDVSSQQERQTNLRNQSGHAFDQESSPDADTAFSSETTRDEKGFTTSHNRVSDSLIDTYV